MSLYILSPVVDIIERDFAVGQTERRCSGQLAIPVECSCFLDKTYHRIAGKQPSESPDNIRDHEVPTCVHRHRTCLLLVVKEWVLTI
jgi:hypothetical protein